MRTNNKQLKNQKEMQTLSRPPRFVDFALLVITEPTTIPTPKRPITSTPLPSPPWLNGSKVIILIIVLILNPMSKARF